MKITIESTTKTVRLDGIEARIWEGATESGIPVFCFIALVGVSESADCKKFEKEL
jgi:hypothetical protein